MPTKRKSTAPHDSQAKSADELKRLTPIVAIGTSAGGLKALSDLLENLPPDLGFVYIVIQHLSPTHESILPELLARKTGMPMHTVTNGMKIEPDNVYVIPPNSFMSIIDSKLILSERVKTNSVYHSVDFFLNALAPVYQAKAIAVILSGSGTDGTLGIQSIKAHGGITFAQDETATFSGMPKTASDSGFTDFVLPCERIAGELASIAKNPAGILSIHEMVEVDETDFKKIKVLLHNKKGVDFGVYKQTTVNRRIMRRMALNKLKNFGEYTKYLGENPNEIDLLYKDLLINVTSFFRDPMVYQALTKKIFPAILKNRKEDETIRIWTPACANGEEAFSLAICLFDYLKDKVHSTPIQIFGTDLNESAIDKARAGVYNKNVLENVSPQRLKHYFVKTAGKYQISKAIRDVCIFATHNLLKDPPFRRMDLISCQNVMIYLETDPQKKILQGFHYALKPSGFLLLGKSEGVGNSTELFGQVDKELKIYSRKQTLPGSNIFDFAMWPAYSPGMPAKDKFISNQLSDIDIEKETNKLLLSRYVPASIVVNKDLQILRFNGAISNYLQPSSGRASLHLLKMVKDEFAFELKALLNHAKKEATAVKKQGVHFSYDGHEREIDIEIVPIKSPTTDFYYLIIFSGNGTVQAPVTNTIATQRPKESKGAHIVKLEQQLNEAREYMKTMSEEFEAAREALQSANEEVLSSNEELQSINEELETSKEELQSTNEELITINDELQQRNNDLKELSDFSHTVLETINEPLLILSTGMQVLSANRAFYTMFKTNIDRIEGHYFLEMENGQWNLPILRKQFSETIQNKKEPKTFEVVHTFPSIGEKALLFSIMPMEQAAHKKSRLLMVIQDVTDRNKAELAAREERFRLLLQNAFDIITIYSKKGDILFQSEALEGSLGYPAKETVGKNIFELDIIHPDDLVIKEKLFQNAIKNPEKNIKGQLRLQHKNGDYKTMDVIFRNLLNNGSIKGIVANYQHVAKAITK